MNSKNIIPIVDLHTDYVLACYKAGKQFGSGKQISIPLMKRSGTKVFFAGFSYDDLLKDTDLQFKVLENELKKRKEFKLVKSKEDFSNVFNEKNKIGVVIHMEGASTLGTSIEKFKTYYEKGLRSIGLTHNYKNTLAAGCKENPNLHLTDFGKKIVKLAQKFGVVVDLSHLNYQGFYDILKIATKPVIVTHTCTYKYCPDPRNLKDEQIKEIARQKGLIGIFFSSKFVRNDGVKADIDYALNHFVHVAEVGGIDVLAIGSDFGGITTGLPKGLENTSKLLDVLEKLKKRGFSNSDIEKITHLNAKKVISNLL